MKTKKEFLFDVVISCIVGFVAFLIGITMYYQCDVLYAGQRMFTENIFTTMYFLLVILTNYIFIELAKLAGYYIKTKNNTKVYIGYICIFLCASILSYFNVQDNILKFDIVFITLITSIILYINKK